MNLHDDEQFLAAKKVYWKNRDELLKQYKGKWIAISGGEVIAVGNTREAVLMEVFNTGIPNPIYTNKVGEESTANIRIYRFI